MGGVRVGSSAIPSDILNMIENLPLDPHLCDALKVQVSQPSTVKEYVQAASQPNHAKLRLLPLQCITLGCLSLSIFFQIDPPFS